MYIYIKILYTVYILRKSIVYVLRTSNTLYAVNCFHNTSTTNTIIDLCSGRIFYSPIYSQYTIRLPLRKHRISLETLYIIRWHHSIFSSTMPPAMVSIYPVKKTRVQQYLAIYSAYHKRCVSEIGHTVKSKIACISILKVEETTSKLVYNKLDHREQKIIYSITLG